MQKNLKDLEQRVAQEQGIDEIGPNMTTKEAGKLGGNMVRELVEEGREMEEEGQSKMKNQ